MVEAKLGEVRLGDDDQVIDIDRFVVATRVFSNLGASTQEAADALRAIGSVWSGSFDIIPPERIVNWSAHPSGSYYVIYRKKVLGVDTKRRTIVRPSARSAYAALTAAVFDGRAVDPDRAAELRELALEEDGEWR